MILNNDLKDIIRGDVYMSKDDELLSSNKIFEHIQL